MAPNNEPRLVGRSSERESLDRLLDAARDHHGSVLVIRGEAGVGKSTLLTYCSEHASDFQVRRAVGVESEMELTFAALHQLCAPLLDRLDALPPPQRAALQVALGLSKGDPPDRFLVALAALSLLSEAAEQQPLLCLVDDAQWLDSASRQVLGFIARRLLAEPMAMVFAVRTPVPQAELGGLPELLLNGLADDEARTLLETVMPGRLDRGVRDRLLAEARGNPLALLEFPRRTSPTQLPGRLGLAQPREVPGRIEETFVQRLDGLSDDARMLILVAAAEPAGDSVLLWRAADQLGIHGSAAAVAESVGLLTIEEHVRFRHPLVRSAAYRSASPDERRTVHLALAQATDRRSDPDRRAWHLAAAASEPDERVAAELERSAGRARARGGLPAAAAFLRRSVALTKDPTKRFERALAAARASLHAGEFDAALDVLSIADRSTVDELERARVDLLRAQVVSASDSPGQALGMLLDAAQRLERLDPELALEAFLDAWGGAMFAGNLADITMRDVSSALQSSGSTDATHAAALLLEGMSTLMTQGRAVAAPMLRRAVDTFLSEPLSMERGMGWGVITSCASVELWDFASWNLIIDRQMQVARDAGALASLAIILNGKNIVLAWAGDLEGADRVGGEANVVTGATGTQIAPFGGMLLAALRGREDESFAMLESVSRWALDEGEGFALQYSHFTTAMLCNGLGRYEAAIEAAQRAWDAWPDWFLAVWAMVELVEAAARLGRPDLGQEPLARVLASTGVSSSEWALGIAFRSRALLSDGAEAESLYRQAIEHLEATQLRPELARAHLVYGEWLRRENRRVDAREQLQLAHSMFSTMGAEGFAERARRELNATGAKAQKRSEQKRDALTPQETHIARLAAEGHTNVQIGQELYLSRHTIEWHLKKVFHKLEISSRFELRDALAIEADDGPALPALS